MVLTFLADVRGGPLEVCGMRGTSQLKYAHREDFLSDDVNIDDDSPAYDKTRSATWRLSNRTNNFTNRPVDCATSVLIDIITKMTSAITSRRL